MEGRAGMETRARQKKILVHQDEIEVGEETGETEPIASRHANAEGEIGLEKILKELREFRKENSEKLVDIIITELQIQRAHRALAPKPTDSARPHSIDVKFLSFKTKEDILGKVWRKGGLKWNNARITCDHDHKKTLICLPH